MQEITEQLVESLKDLSIQDMTTEMTALIRSGTITVGTKLPSVRSLAEALGVSPATISAVWHSLKKSSLIESAGRNGAWVSGNDPSPRPRRFENVGNFGKKTKVDLTYSGPDPALLPNLEPALCYATTTSNIHSYQRQFITPELQAAIQSQWPYAAKSFIATNGGFDGLQAIFSALIQPGSWVAVEEPTSARVLDLLDNLGIRVIPVICDEEGPTIEALQAAMEKKLAGLIFQPRTHSVLGTSLSPRRIEQLIPLLADIPLIIEDDGIGPVSEMPDMTFGQQFPDKVIHLRSYSKTLGPDLRLAVMSTTHERATSIQAFRNFGASWTSRLLQNAAAYLITQPQYGPFLQQSRQEYAKRRQAFTQALSSAKIPFEGTSGLSVWIPVPSEQYALVTLAIHGFAVFPSRRFYSQPSPGGAGHIRIATSTLTADLIDPLVEVIKLCFE